MEKLVADADHTDALTSIAECLRTADQQHVVVGVAGHGRLVRWFERYAQVFAEIHGEVSQVFHHNGIILGGQCANCLQLALCQADPRGVVGIGIDNSADVTLAEIALEFGLQLVATEVIDIECLVLHALHL